MHDTAILFSFICINQFLRKRRGYKEFKYGVLSKNMYFTGNANVVNQMYALFKTVQGDNET